MDKVNILLSEEKTGHIIRRTYQCPCGKGTIWEEQDYTPGHRDCMAVLHCDSCDKKYTLKFNESGLKWYLERSTLTDPSFVKEIKNEMERKGMSDNFIIEVISKKMGRQMAIDLFNKSLLLQYIDNKTKSVDRSSKSRGSFANLYAIYVLAEDYVNKGYMNSRNYSSYDGMMFTDALTRTRELPFGEKLQNHALNNRCNDEFRKFFSTQTAEVPIIRNLETKRYWINEKLLLVDLKSGQAVNIAQLCIEIIDRYVELKLENFESFFSVLSDQKEIVTTDPQSVLQFLAGLLNPNTDARIFEIVSYVIIKYHYINHTIRYSIDGQKEHIVPLQVYKTGRTNANDGGIDFIMVPLGRVFQVTEVLDFKKYFLDIDKLIHYPITFVVKQDITPAEALRKIEREASEKYKDRAVLEHYLSCFQEIITIPRLNDILSNNIKNGYLSAMIDELITQCKIEYNIDEE